MGAAARTENARIAERLLEAAGLLQARGASLRSAAAYRAAARAIAHHRRDVRAIFESQGAKGLDAIPHVSLGIAAAVAEMLETGRWTRLEQWREEADPATVFRSVPGVGIGLARRFRDELHLGSLEALEVAARDGRIEHLRGVGPRRAAALRGTLDEMLRPPRQADLRLPPDWHA